MLFPSDKGVLGLQPDTRSFGVLFEDADGVLDLTAGFFQCSRRRTRLGIARGLANALRRAPLCLGFRFAFGSGSLQRSRRSVLGARPSGRAAITAFAPLAAITTPATKAKW